MDTVIFRSLAIPPNEAQISVQLAHQPKHDPSSNTSARVYIFNLNTKHFQHYHNTHIYQTSTHTDEHVWISYISFFFEVNPCLEAYLCMIIEHSELFLITEFESVYPW